MTPGDKDLETHYANDGLRPFNIILMHNDVPANLTGAQARLQLRTDKSATSNNVVYEFATGGTGDSLITISNPTGGVLTIAEILSWTVPAGKYYYDLQVTDNGGFVRTYLKGMWVVNQDITR